MGSDPESPEPKNEETTFHRWGIPENISEEEAQEVINRIFFTT